MGRIYYLMGKSASGKDTIYRRILEARPDLKRVVLYTTRPMREGEREGIEYYFTTPEKLEDFRRAGKVIEQRTYPSVHGPWTYATVDDGQIDLDKGDYLVIGTLESYEKLKDYFGERAVEPLYVTVDDGLRLMRALERERQQSEPKYAEMCRRFLADEEDFSEENRKKCGIVREYRNDDLNACVEEILEVIQNG